MTAINDRLARKSVSISETGCRIWLGSIDGDGYGRIGLNGKNKHAHRVAFELDRGQIPAGKVLDHLCRVRCCVNPAHLDPVTRGENTRRGHTHLMGVINREKTHCPRGHAYTEENTRLTYRVRFDGMKRAKRHCKACES